MSSQVTQNSVSSKSTQLDQYVSRQIDRTSFTIRWIEILTTMFLVSTVFLGGLLTFCIVDAWVVAFSPIARLLVLLLLAGGCLGYFAWRTVPLLIYKINPQFAAKLIEQSQPGIKNSLLNYLLLRNEKQALNRSVFQHLQNRAATDLAATSVESSVDRSKLIKITAVMLGIVLFSIVYKFVSPKDPFQSIARLAAPLSAIASPSRVRILEVTPGDTEVFFGDEVNIVVQIKGLGKSEDVVVLYSSQNNEIQDAVLPLNTDEARKTFRGVLSTGQDGIQQSLTYKIVAGDAESQPFMIRVSPRPTFSVQTIELIPPKYTGLPKRVQKRKAEISSVEGTQVTVNAMANLPIKNAFIELTDENRPSSIQTIPMEFNEQTATGKFKLLAYKKRIDEKLQTVPSFTHYQLLFESTDGKRTKNSPRFPIEIQPDVAPEVIIETPVNLETKVPENRTQSIIVSATDPDYGISSIELRMVHKGVEIVNETLKLQKQSSAGEAMGRFGFLPSKYGLKPNDVVNFFAIASDNRQSPNSGLHDPNTARTENYKIIVLPPEVTPEGAGGTDSEDDPNNPNQQDNKNPENKNDKDQKNNSTDKKSTDKTYEQNQTTKKQNDQKQRPNKSNQKQDNQENKDNQSDKPDNQNDKKDSKSGDSADKQKQKNDNQKSDSKSGKNDSKKEKSGKQDSKQKKNGNKKSDNQQNNDGKKKSDQQTTGDNKSQSEQKSNDGQDDTGNPNDSASKQDNSSSQSNKKTNNDNQQVGDNPQQQQQPEDSAAKDFQQSQGVSPPRDRHDGRVMEQIEKIRKELEKLKQQQSEDNENSSDQNQNPENKDNQSNSDPDNNDTNDSQKPNSKDQNSSGKKSESKDSAGKNKADKKSDDSKTGGAKKSDSNKSDSKTDNAKKSNSNKSDSKTGDAKKSDSDKSDSKNNASNKSDTKGSDGKAADDKTPKDKAADKGDNKKSDTKEKSPSSTNKSDSKMSGDSKSEKSQDGKSGDAKNKDNTNAADKKGKDDKKSDDSNSSGNKKSNQKTDSEKSDRTKSDQNSKNKSNTGQSNKSAKKNSDNKSNSKANGKSADGQKSNEASPRDKAKNKSKKSDNSNVLNQPGSGNRSSNPKNSNSSSPFADQLSTEQKANLEYSKKVAELALEYLKNQKENPDPEFLKKMNWTKDEMLEFTRRWEDMKKNADLGKLDGVENYTEALRSLGLRDPSIKSFTDQLKTDDLKGLNEDGAVNKIPSQFAKELKQFQRFRSKARRDNNR